jgi:hypothetical protein
LLLNRHFDDVVLVDSPREVVTGLFKDLKMTVGQQVNATEILQGMHLSNCALVWLLVLVDLSLGEPPSS